MVEEKYFRNELSIIKTNRSTSRLFVFKHGYCASPSSVTCPDCVTCPGAIRANICFVISGILIDS